MSNSAYRVKEGTTDEQFVRILEELLPDALVRRFKMDPLRAKQAAPKLARAMVEAANQCAESHRLPDVSRKIELIGQPSEAQCKEFKEWADSILVIRRGAPGRLHPIKKVSGKIWGIMNELTGTVNKEWEEQQKESNAVVGDRG